MCVCVEVVLWRSCYYFHYCIRSHIKMTEKNMWNFIWTRTRTRTTPSLCVYVHGFHWDYSFDQNWGFSQFTLANYSIDIKFIAAFGVVAVVCTCVLCKTQSRNNKCCEKDTREFIGMEWKCSKCIVSIWRFCRCNDEKNPLWLVLCASDPLSEANLAKPN